MNISLERMNQQDFDIYKKQTIPSYAHAKETAEGIPTQEALKLAETSYNNLLPQGIKTEGHHLFKIINSDSFEQVGILWFAHKNEYQKSYAYIYDIELNSKFRGKGLGKKTMQLLETEVKKLGLSTISLHVFAYNKSAIGLYQKMGYAVRNQVMEKKL